MTVQSVRAVAGGGFEVSEQPGLPGLQGLKGLHGRLAPGEGNEVRARRT
ncbi:hypothetical protein ACQ4WX_21930 [Streptomyces lasalocidi]